MFWHTSESQKYLIKNKSTEVIRRNKNNLFPITMCFEWHPSESQKYLIKNKSTKGRIKIKIIHTDN